MKWPMKDKTAIAGIGWTKYVKKSGVSVLALALEACKNAIEDAGLKPADVDGIISYAVNDSINVNSVSTHLGMQRLNFLADLSGGGNLSCASVADAAMAIATGNAKNVLVFRALNGASGIRWGDSNAKMLDMLSTTGACSDSFGQFLAPFGCDVWVTHFAWLAKRYMIKYGFNARQMASQLGAIAITSRNHAILNDRAMMRTPLTTDDYERSPMISEPLHSLDCCLRTDGACALLVTSDEQANDLKHRPVYVMGASQGGGPNTRDISWANYYNDHTRSYATYIAPLLFERAAISTKDVDVAEIYDCFTFSVLAQLEDWGFCKNGEGGQFVLEGHTALGNELPVNTHGGLLSEAYIHGLNSVVEAVSQLRGDAGPRQVKNAEIAFVSGGGAGTLGCGLILRR